MAATLKALNGGESIPLEDFNLVGRSDKADIQLQDAGVSRQHATINREGQHYWITDLGSANGSYVNDVAIAPSRVLRDGDRLQLGTATFLFDQGVGAGGNTTEQTVIGGKTQMLSRSPAPVPTQRATLLVGDLKGFTQLSSQMGASELAELLREWYADCNAIMKRNGAMIDKFIGDCVFAYWPGVDDTTRRAAVEAAKALRVVEETATSPMRMQMRREKNIVLDCRVGLHVGDAAIGTMGKGVNTALGDAVNMVFRIEGLTRQVDREILCSAQFLDGWAADRAEFEPCGAFDVKGHPQKVELYAVRR